MPQHNPKAPRRRKQRTVSLPPSLRRVNLHAAGIDIGATCHFAAVPEGADPEGQDVREFGAFTTDLHALADWLQTCGVKTIAMESTGVYWIPLYELLESRGFQVLLVDPRRLKHVPGRKTDVLDCQWLQQLHTFGLLSGAFRPKEQVCVLRSYLREREAMIAETSQHIQHMQKALTQMNIKLQHVIGDIMGVTGAKIVRAILAGERDPVALASLRDHRCKSPEATIAKALQGNWRDEHLFALQMAVERFDFYHRQIRDCDLVVEGLLREFEDRSHGAKPPKAKDARKPGRNQPKFDLRGYLFSMTGVDLTQIEGIHAHTVLKIFGEIGADMTPWDSAKKFASWLGICPGSKKSGGKQISSRTKPCANRVATALRLAAYSLHHSKSALGAFFRRKAAQIGKPQAITATAHKLARLIYSMLKYGTDYVAKGQDDYEKHYQHRVLHNLSRSARSLGYKLVPASDLPAGPDPTSALS